MASHNNLLPPVANSGSTPYWWTGDSGGGPEVTLRDDHVQCPSRFSSPSPVPAAGAERPGGGARAGGAQANPGSSSGGDHLRRSRTAARHGDSARARTGRTRSTASLRTSNTRTGPQRPGRDAAGLIGERGGVRPVGERRLRRARQVLPGPGGPRLGWVGGCEGPSRRSRCEEAGRAAKPIRRIHTRTALRTRPRFATQPGPDRVRRTHDTAS